MKLLFFELIFIGLVFRSHTRVISEIALFGNGIAVWPVHHTVIVVYYGDENYYELLDLLDADGGIEIVRSTGKTEEEALKGRVRDKDAVKRWGDNAKVCCPASKIEALIKEYNGAAYKIWSFPQRHCRTFVNDIMIVCGSNKRTSSWEGGYRGRKSRSISGLVDSHISSSNTIIGKLTAKTESSNSHSTKYKSRKARNLAVCDCHSACARGLMKNKEFQNKCIKDGSFDTFFC